ncbi:helix-turn-helix domain-containing protein [Streptomyces sp.]|uniref:helix-turn-helix domain-containing protein n=1 Tax=Streptomyces sp. TaxID=1931 RepID=UPI003BEED735
MRVSQGRLDVMALALLDLVVKQAPLEEFDDIVRQAYETGASREKLVALERIRNVGMTVQEQVKRHQQREAGLAALVDTARDIAAHADLDTLLKVLTRRARLLLGSDMAYVGIPEPETGTLCIRTADGHTSMLTVGLRLPRTGGLGNSVVAAGAPFWTADYLSDPKINHSPLIDEVVRSENLRAIMTVPLSHATTPFGALYVADRRVRHYTADEVALLSSLGDLAGVAVDRTTRLTQLTTALASANALTAQAQGHLRTATELFLLHKDLLDLALGDSEVGALASATSRRLGGSVRLTAPDGTVLAAAGPPLTERDVPEPAVRDADAADSPALVGGNTWVAPVRGGGEYLGALVLRLGSLPEQPFDTWPAIVAQAFAALLLRRRTPQLTTEQASDELLDELLIGGLRPPQRQHQRALRLSLDLNKPNVLVVARPEENSHQRITSWAVQYARRLRGLKTVQQDHVVILLPGSDPSAAAHDVRAELTARLGHPVTVSASGPVQDAASVSHAYKEALRCLDAMTAIGATGQAASARDLGFIGVLLADNHDIEGFITATIGRVIDYDEQRFTELTRTLKAYYDTGASPSQAAQRLHVHPNTVGRRLERINDLLGSDWQQPHRALEIQLALRLSEIRAVLRHDSASPQEREAYREGPTGGSPSGSERLRRGRPKQG